MVEFTRRKSKQIFVGNVPIGGGAPISIQSMTNTETADAESTLRQINALYENGCQIARVTVPNNQAVEGLKIITKESPIPIIADIHFDYQMALKSIEAGVNGLRLNPGNIGGKEKVIEVAKAAKYEGIPIRVGVNGGSLDKKLLAKYGGVCGDAMVESALEQIHILEDANFDVIKVSLKSSNVPLMLDAYTKLGALCDYPFHIGVTESGMVERGSIKSAAGIGALISRGLGDTMRVSLAGDPVNEIFVCKEILRAFGMYNSGVTYVVCPTCGRTKYDLMTVASQVEERLEALNIQKPLKVAIMGCVVNGPGEARDADVGIAGGVDNGMIFVKGVEVGRYPTNELVDRLVDKVMEIVEEDK